MSRSDREHQEQAALYEWIELVGHRHHAELLDLFAIPNGGHRHIAVAKKMKAEGVKAGVLDNLLPVARAGFIGLWLEMKAGKNKLTEKQLDWGRRMRANGYAVTVCYSWEAAVQALMDYMEGRPVQGMYPLPN